MSFKAPLTAVATAALMAATIYVGIEATGHRAEAAATRNIAATSPAATAKATVLAERDEFASVPKAGISTRAEKPLSIDNEAGRHIRKVGPSFFPDH